MNDLGNNLNLSYEKVENELINDLNALDPSDHAAINQRIDIFTEKYLIKSDSWSRFSRKMNCKDWREYLKRSVYYFCFDGTQPSYGKNTHFKFLMHKEWHNNDIARIFSEDLEYYIYPHSELVNEHDYLTSIYPDNYLKILHRVFPKPLSKILIEKFDNAVKFYKKLKELENDDKKWFEFIQEWDDEEFIIHSIEFRISENLQNKYLWKLYIEFWRLKNPKIMVGVYSRYCSFFLDDFEMKEEYKKEAEKLGIFVNDRILDYKEFQSLPFSKVPTKKECFIPKTNFNNYLPQSFPFHNSFVNYLMDATKAEVLQKLFMSCKYFFYRQPTPICHRLFLEKGERWHLPDMNFKSSAYSEKTFFDQQSLTVGNEHPCLKDLKNLILSNSLYLTYTPSLGRKFINFLPKIYRSEIKFLTVSDYNISVTEYLFLTESKTVLEMHFTHAHVYNPDKSLVYFEDLMITLPNAYEILITKWCFPPVSDTSLQTFDKIAEMSRNCKLQKFEFSTFKELSFNFDGFLKLLKKNMKYDLHYVIEIVDVTDVETFKTDKLNVISAFLEEIPDFSKKCSTRTGENYVICKDWREYLKRSVYYFCFDGTQPSYGKNTHFKFLMHKEWHNNDIARIFSEDLEYYIYPHSELVNEHDYLTSIYPDNYLKILHRVFPKSLSKILIEKFDNAVKFYKKLKELENDDKKWFEFIQEWDDEEFIIHSIEFRISENLQNKYLWKLYIEFWRLKNPKIMVGVYSRYCSFFLDDFEMKEEYKKEAEKLGIFVNDRILDYKEFQSLPFSKVPTKKECFIPKTNFNNYLPQSFPFHNSFVNYLMDATKAEVLQKLFMSCKYFFYRQPTPICHRLFLEKGERWHLPDINFKSSAYSEKTFFDQQSLTVGNEHPCLKDLKNLILSNSLYLTYTPSLGRKFINFLPKIYRSEIKFLTVSDYNISVTEYLFLTESKTVLEMHFTHAHVYNPDKSLVYFEDLMITLPNAYEILITKWCFPPVSDTSLQTFDKIAEMSRNCKLQKFEFSTFKELSFNFDGFLKLLKKNMKYDLHYVIEIVDVTDVETFKTDKLNVISAFLEEIPDFSKKCSTRTGENYVMLIIK